MSVEYSDVAKRLIEYRLKMKMTQRQMADAIKINQSHLRKLKKDFSCKNVKLIVR